MLLLVSDVPTVRDVLVNAPSDFSLEISFCQITAPDPQFGLAIVGLRNAPVTVGSFGNRRETWRNIDPISEPRVVVGAPIGGCEMATTEAQRRAVIAIVFIAAAC
ncbi:hypothetical protein [Mesorhizobium sp.]|uniref:hypothetical protein n=1 Tax=Mesorhizobium sp. TaxID=1871066 RepID=UPI000FE79D37|nr:hypothetical protein [Mesorhizobium sp.]RWA98304.1 MAG: hypothetical protein EOQ33_27695 [Mesorhizobium sp.]